MAIHHPCKQNSAEWLTLRTGIPTASSFGKIVTPAKGELSKQAEEYMYQLVAESIVGHVIDFESKWMERGHELEGEAVKIYKLHTGTDTLESGFWTTDDGLTGASPDRLIGEDGILEIKCPAPHTQIGYLLDRAVDRKYYSQIQGQLFVCERKWVDICAYCPELPPVIIRVERDEPFIATLSGALAEFNTKLAALKERVKGLAK